MVGLKDMNCPMLEYCWQLIQEYGILEKAQVFRLLKKATELSQKQRHTLGIRLAQQIHVHELCHEGRLYLTNMPGTVVNKRHIRRVRCLCVLFDYIDRVDRHYATGTLSQISLVIQDRDYDILYIDKGSERFSLRHMEKGASTRYIAVVENTAQIPLLAIPAVHSYVLVNAKGETEYYTRGDAK